MLIRVTDFEATGFSDDPEGAAICEVGWCDVLVGTAGDIEIAPPTGLLCNPGRAMPAVARAVHHLGDDVLALEPPPETALRLCAGNGDVTYFCAHNSRFEEAFWPDAPAPWIDTYRVALRLWPDAPSHSNQVLRYWLGLDLDEDLAMPPHRAAPDAYVTAHLLKVAIENGAASIEDMVKWSAGPALLPRVPFGKHFGQKWDDVPTDYLRWVVGQADMDRDVRANAKRHLKIREEG